MNPPARSLCRNDDPLYPRLKEFLIVSTGLAYYAERDQDLGEIIGRRLSELGCENCGSYLELLTHASQRHSEMDRVVEQLTIGETYFFRHAEQFDALKDCIIPEIIARNRCRRRLRIWSAGCANGAEAYSVAILLQREFGDQVAGWDVTILGTDINRKSLADAREGRFAEWHFRSTPAAVKESCFERESQAWFIRPKHKEWVAFQYHNLVGHPFAAPLQEVDLILCRNVTIYFSSEVTRGVIQNFHDVLGDQDWLVVGHAEPNGESFCCFRAVYRPGVTLYQKSATRIIVSTNAPPPLAKAPLWAGGAMPLIATQLPARHINGGTAVAMVRSDTPAHQESRIPLSELARLRLLANSGDVESTLLCCQELLEKDRCNPLIYFYRAMALEILGAYEEAEGSLRQVIYLDRRFILAHYQLGLIRQRARNDRQAVQAFTNLLRLLSGIPDQQTLAETEGMTAAELKRLAQAHLKILDGSLKKIWTAD